MVDNDSGMVDDSHDGHNAEDKANPKPWYTMDEKSSKMSTEDLLELTGEYPLPEGWYARLPGLQEPANYGTKFEIGIYEEQVKSGYRLHLHPFALRFFQHYHMAPGQLVPNGWRKLPGLIYLVQTSSYKPDATDFMRKWLAEVENRSKEAFLGKRKEKQPSVELPPAPKKTRITPPDRSPLIIKIVSINEDPIFGPRWILRCDDIGMPDNQISKHHLVHGVLPRDKEAVAAEEAQQKRDTVKEVEEATHHVEELSKQEADYLARIETLERRLKQKWGEEWLKERTDDGLEIYEMGFMKAKEMFVERFPDIPLGDFVVPAVVFPSGETAMPSDAGDAAASHSPGEGPPGDTPEL
ncbi:hypothetical protein RJ639_047332 [Escallonia herrerae]|uniref:Transposase (putative) gypsy type domain-containing protein n=1 Tax=Escallonia herrerae TaxID=1293975 RepID=A0AA89AYN4_9ASTE|nr:hypothetical protein RJ639_047332 [Escallonia herrerae]